MIDIDRVYEVLEVLSGKSADELRCLAPIVSNAISVMSRLVKEECHGEERAVFLTASKANYDIYLISQCENDGVTSFSAGDVKITQKSNDGNCAGEIYNSALQASADLILDNGFAFLGV